MATRHATMTGMLPAVVLLGILLAYFPLPMHAEPFATQSSMVHVGEYYFEYRYTPTSFTDLLDLNLTYRGAAGHPAVLDTEEKFRAVAALLECTRSYAWIGAEEPPRTAPAGTGSSQQPTTRV
eukprot:m.236129 g.236129  ORF g.236129 m.236129 type:complete len:123 (+) comp10895_c0_seq1:262-630(+)